MSVRLAVSIEASAATAVTSIAHNRIGCRGLEASAVNASIITHLTATPTGLFVAWVMTSRTRPTAVNAPPDFREIGLGCHPP